MSSGHLQRRVVESCRAYCDDCKEIVTNWLPYDEAISLFIDHRKERHHK